MGFADIVDVKTRLVVKHFILSSMFMYILVENFLSVCQLVRITQKLAKGMGKGFSIEGKYFSRKE